MIRGAAKTVPVLQLSLILRITPSLLNVYRTGAGLPCRNGVLWLRKHLPALHSMMLLLRSGHADSGAAGLKKVKAEELRCPQFIQLPTPVHGIWRILCDMVRIRIRVRH